MPRIRVAGRAHNRELVEDPRLEWQVFADLDPRNIGGDRLELAANLGRGQPASLECTVDSFRQGEAGMEAVLSGCRLSK